MTFRTLLLVDGEHYPPVIIDALPTLRGRGFNPVAAVFLGGFEKASAPPDLGVPTYREPVETVLVDVISRHQIEVVLDLSDEPIIDHRTRLRLASMATTAGAAYEAGGMRFDPLPRPRLTTLPTVAVIGTGKRTGKTAVSIELARRLVTMGARPCIVTMGRGGPEAPVVIRAGSKEDPIRMLEDLAGQGLHATSDYVEDAIFAGVDTIGTRRLGAGPTGITVHDGFAAGVEAAEQLSPDILIYEGSGTAIPPAHADRTITVVGTAIDLELVTGYLGPVRLSLSDALVLVGSADAAFVTAIEQMAPDLPVFHATLRPEPMVSVDGKRVVLVTTAPVGVSGVIAGFLEDLGATEVDVVNTLSDRRRLTADLAAIIRPGDVVLTEIKAAAADIVLPQARTIGAEIGLVHNAVDLNPSWEVLCDLVDPRSRSVPISADVDPTG